MLETDIATIKKKSLVGVVALTTRTFILGLIGLLANQIILPLLLTPAIFGVYFVVSAVISFMGYFSDIGLAASLVQKKEMLTKSDLQTTFTIQQILVGSAVLFVLVFSEQIASFYRFGPEGMWLLRALVIAFFLSSLKTIPSILLERELAFDRLVIPTFVETLVFYLTVVFLAWRGYGIASFSWGVLLRALTGTIAIYYIQPWSVGLRIDRDVAKKLLRFGIPFQLNSFLALLKDDVMTLFLGRVLNFTEVGYIGWAKKWAEVPLRLFMDNVIRITFPAFARMQHDTKSLGKAIEKTIYGLSLTTFPLYIVLLFFIHQFVYLLPKYIRYAPALPSFYIFAIASIIACLNTPLTNALNAIGKVKITLNFMIGYVVLTWVLTVPFLKLFGFHGFSLAVCIIAFTIILTIYFVKQSIHFSFITYIRGPFLASVIQAVWYFILLRSVPNTYGWLVIVGGLGVLLYLVVLYMIEGIRLKEFIRVIRNSRS